MIILNVDREHKCKKQRERCKKTQDKRQETDTSKDKEGAEASSRVRDKDCDKDRPILVAGGRR